MKPMRLQFYLKDLRILFLLLLLFLASCHRLGDESSGPEKKKDKVTKAVKFDLDKIRERGSLVAIVENSSTGFFIYKGRPMGYEYELISRFARDIGVELELQITNSMDSAFAMLLDGRGDIMAYNLTVTKERKKVVDFTEFH